MLYKTDFKYTDRKTKSKYVYLKYKEILIESILDVGADVCSLKEHLGEDVFYKGIGLGSEVDEEVDLEKQTIPYEDNSFNCVLCLDVLEHLENIHDVFNDLCRITKQYVIISLPNPHGVFFNYLKDGNYSDSQHIKFYGLPTQKPEDRHKWFFSAQEAQNFLKTKAVENNMDIIQLDYQNDVVPKVGFLDKILFWILSKKYCKLDFFNKNLYLGPMWAVLKKR